MSPLIVANWKSHKHAADVQPWVSEVAEKVGVTTVQMVIAPPFPLVGVVAEAVAGSLLAGRAAVAVQDLSPFPAGAYTGAVSAENLRDWPVKFALLGHSERRRYFEENHLDVANKADQALSAQITPVICLDDEYHLAQYNALSEQARRQCVVAYEPIEAIGSGLDQPASEVAQVVKKIRQSWGEVPIIYGGSVAADNVAEYLEVCQGVLVGGKSLKASDFAALINAAI